MNLKDFLNMMNDPNQTSDDVRRFLRNHQQRERQREKTTRSFLDSLRDAIDETMDDDPLEDIRSFAEKLREAEQRERTKAREETIFEDTMRADRERVFNGEWFKTVWETQHGTPPRGPHCRSGPAHDGKKYEPFGEKEAIELLVTEFINYSMTQFSWPRVARDRGTVTAQVHMIVGEIKERSRQKEWRERVERWRRFADGRGLTFIGYIDHHGTWKGEQ